MTITITKEEIEKLDETYWKDHQVDGITFIRWLHDGGHYGYGSHADNAIFTGFYLAAASFRYGVEPNKSNLTKIEELEDKLNKQMEENVQLKKQKGELVKESMIADVADGMTDTETEKFQSLVDDVEFSDEDSYTEKLQVIKESYFGTGKVEVKETETLTEEGSEETVDVSNTMAGYIKAIKKDESRSKK